MFSYEFLKFMQTMQEPEKKEEKKENLTGTSTTPLFYLLLKVNLSARGN